MKKADVMDIINDTQHNRVLCINPLCYLERTTVDPLYKTPVDWLHLNFVSINHMGKFAGSVKIISRDYDSIKKEVENAIRERMQDLTEYLCNALQNGCTI